MIITGQQHCCFTQRVGPHWQTGCLGIGSAQTAQRYRKISGLIVCFSNHDIILRTSSSHSLFPCQRTESREMLLMSFSFIHRKKKSQITEARVIIEVTSQPRFQQVIFQAYEMKAPEF